MPQEIFKEIIHFTRFTTKVSAIGVRIINIIISPNLTLQMKHTKFGKDSLDSC